jgi:hypothetical protein
MVPAVSPIGVVAGTSATGTSAGPKYAGFPLDEIKDRLYGVRKAGSFNVTELRAIAKAVGADHTGKKKQLAANIAAKLQISVNTP